MINWQLFPRYSAIPDHLMTVVDIFKQKSASVDSENAEMSREEVLNLLSDDLEVAGYKLERVRRKERVMVPVLFGRNGEMERAFNADGIHRIFRTVLEIEAEKTVSCNLYLQALMQASMMSDVDYLILAVRNNSNGQQEFEIVADFVDLLYANGRFHLPLKNVLIIGY